MPQSTFYGWKLLAAFWVIYLVNLGFPNYGSSVLNAYMAQDLHLDRKMLGSAYSVYQLMVGLPAPLIAYCVIRMGVRITLVLGSLMVLAGSLVMSFFVHTGWQAVLGFGVVVGLGSAAGGSLAAQTGIARWFVRRRAMALAIMFSAGGIGGFVAAPLLNAIIARAGGNWRVGWWLIAALAVIAAILAALYVKESPSDVGQLPEGSSEGQAAPEPAESRRRLRVYRTTEEWTFSEAVRTRAFLLLMLGQLGISMGFAMFMAHGVVHLRDLGHSPAAAAMGMSVLVIATLVGKLAAGFGDRIEPRYLWASALTLFGLGLIMAVNATGAADLYPFAILLGYGWGVSLVCVMAVPINFFGPKAYTSLLGLTLTIQTTTAAISPVIAGYLYDEYRSYAAIFYSISVMCFAGCVLLLMAKPPKRKPAVSGAETELNRSIVEMPSNSLANAGGLSGA